MFKKFLWILLAAFIIIQFIHPKRNRKEGPQPNNIANNFPMPPDVKQVLAVACMDCHSNNTRYPWYSKIQPVDWWLNDHVVDGKKELNFDEYTNKSLRYQYHKMEEAIEMVEDNKMPLKSYTWTHRDARLSDNQRLLIVNWARSVMKQMENTYPMDSLVRKN